MVWSVECGVWKRTEWNWYLHGEDSGDEASAGASVGVLGHDSGGQGVVATDAESQPEPEEAKSSDNRSGCVTH